MCAMTINDETVTYAEVAIDSLGLQPCTDDGLPLLDRDFISFQNTHPATTHLTT